jgi:prefoldin subunit 5
MLESKKTQLEQVKQQIGQLQQQLDGLRLQEQELTEYVDRFNFNA